MYVFKLGNLLLPVTPGSLELKIDNKNETISLINDGDVNVLKRPGLTEISFDALLPNVEYPFAVYQNGFKPADHYTTWLKNKKNAAAPFQLQIGNQRGTSLGNSVYSTILSITVALEGYTLKEDAERHGRDVYASVKLKEYKSIVTKKITLNRNSDGDVTATSETQRDTSTKPDIDDYTVKSGDSLWGIAKKYLGNGSKFPEIYTLNKDVIEAAAKKHGRASSSNGHWIYPGTVLKIPK